MLSEGKQDGIHKITIEKINQICYNYFNKLKYESEDFIMISIDEKNGITLTRGDTASLTLTIKDAEEQSYDFSDDVVKFGIKRSPFDKECVIEKVVDSETGIIEFKPEDTEQLEFGDYLYDIEVRHTVEAETEEEEDEVQVYTVIAAARFSLGWNIL